MDVLEAGPPEEGEEGEAGAGSAAAGEAVPGVPPSAASRARADPNGWMVTDPDTVGEGAPEELRCPLTGRLFRDPVRIHSGQVFERQALRKFLSDDDRSFCSAPQCLLDMVEKGYDLTEEELKLFADAEKLRAVRRWLEEHPSGIVSENDAEGTTGAGGGDSRSRTRGSRTHGHWFVSRVLEDRRSQIAHVNTIPVMLHSKMTQRAACLSIWQQREFKGDFRPTVSTLWHNKKHSGDGFTTGSTLGGGGSLPLSYMLQQIGVAYTVARWSGGPQRWPSAFEDEELRLTPRFFGLPNPIRS